MYGFIIFKGYDDTKVCVRKEFILKIIPNSISGYDVVYTDLTFTTVPVYSAVELMATLVEVSL